MMKKFNQQNNDLAYRKVLSYAKQHYENFPVVSFLIPKDLRKHIAIIYWFARTADDLADEGNLTEIERIKKLEDFELEFTESINGGSENIFFEALNSTIQEKKLTTDYFIHLLSAFKQDVNKKRYENYDELLDYCKRSANPVGRLILELFDIREVTANNFSDKICTALQLTNFYQDVSEDIKKGRIYFPVDEMQKHKVTETMFELGENNINLSALVEYNIERAENLFDDGKGLLKFLSGRLYHEIKLTVAGGMEILSRIRKNDYNIFVRPKLNKKDFIKILIKSLIK